MQEKSVTLTPNKRLARYLQKQFCLTCTKQNTWHSVKILPLTAWIINCWQNLPDSRVLLNSHQEKLLWQKIIAENLNDRSRNIADYAINAHELINGWQLREKEYDTSATEDIIIFQRLYKKFKEYCKEKNLVTSSELPTLLLPQVANYKLEKIIFAGFDEYNLQLQSVIAAIRETGCKILELDPNNHQNSTQRRLGFNNLKQEISTCAKWAKQILNQSHKSNIGIVVPNLVDLRSKISPIFDEILGNNNINISVGIPLSVAPIINCALELLSVTEIVSLKKISKILLSPYIDGAEIERSERAILNQQLHQLEPHQFGSIYINRLPKEQTKNVPVLAIILQKWQELLSQVQNKILYGSEWAPIFTEILKTLGWPGENNLTDLELDAIQHFFQVLQEITATNLIIGKISYKKALQILSELTSHITLQPKYNQDSPINIIGTLEAAGVNFDHLWVMGLDQENWPPAPRPNPFIPIATQKKLFLPHASAERELYFCKMLIERYKRSAQDIIFSYVKQAEDRSIEPSPLIINIPEISVNDLDLAPDYSLAQKIYQTQKLESLTSDQAPRLAPNEIPHASSRLIELQSLCPFQAFMEFRLATKEPKKPGLGISKITRGTVIHQTLERFWQMIKTQENLCRLNSTELQELIENSIKSSLYTLELPQPLYKLEKQCLTSLLNRWVEIEKTRAPFQVIATEKSVQINLASIPIRLRIDRIDQLTENNTLLIDYKTGKNLPSIFDWFGPRPKNLQLLLYILAIDTIQGLALAQINIESIKFKNIGLNELALGLRTVDPNESDLTKNITWDELIKYWQNILTKIADDFTSGHAAPIPISPQTCKQCSFGPVCRKKEGAKYPCHNYEHQT